MKKKTTIIVPCYNEEKRGVDFLNKLVEFTKNNLNNYEILLVDDGSTDKTFDLLKKIQSKDKANIRIVKITPNQGKGAAIKKAVFQSNGENVLFIDADGSISPNQIPKLLNKLKNNDLAIGYRYSKQANVKQPVARKITGSLFNLYVNLLYNLKIYDCLCGFKAFKKNIARDLFKNLIDKRWLFDVEILFKTKKNKYKVSMVPIRWEHKEGTKIKPWDPFVFLFKLLVLRFKLFKS